MRRRPQIICMCHILQKGNELNRRREIKRWHMVALFFPLETASKELQNGMQFDFVDHTPSCVLIQ